MSNVTQVGLVVGFSLLTLSCQFEFDILFINESGSLVVVSVGKESETIDAGKSARLHYPYLGGVDREMIVVRVGRCELRYHVPEDPSEIPRSSEMRGPLSVQLSKDFSIDVLLPNTTSGTSASEAARFQGGAFPLKPEDQHSCLRARKP